MAETAASRGTTASRSRLKRWTERVNNSPNAMWALFWASFAETIIVPIPIELVLIPFMVMNRHRLWLTAAVVTAGCLLASMIGYGVGFLFFDTIGQDIIAWAGWSDQLERFRKLFDSYGFWAVMAVGITPIPFQVAMLAAGAAGYPILMFVLAATLARGIRYFGLALLVCLFGRRTEELFRRHKRTGTLVVTAIVLAIAALAIWL